MKKRTHKRSSYRPTLEILEDRFVPALDPLNLPQWIEQGPGPANTPGGVVGLEGNPINGAIQSVLAHPTDPDIDSRSAWTIPARSPPTSMPRTTLRSTFLVRFTPHVETDCQRRDRF